MLVAAPGSIAGDPEAEDQGSTPIFRPEAVSSGGRGVTDSCLAPAGFLRSMQK